jgi:hypothetical protein
VLRETYATGTDKLAACGYGHGIAGWKATPHAKSEWDEQNLLANIRNM